MNTAVYITKLYNANKGFYDGIRRTDETKNRRNNSFVKFLWLRGLYYKAIIDKNEDKYNEYYGKVKDAIFEIMEDGVDDYFNVCCLNMLLHKQERHGRILYTTESGFIEVNDGGYLKVCNFMKDIFENFKETHNNIKEGVFENQF